MDGCSPGRSLPVSAALPLSNAMPRFPAHDGNPVAPRRREKEHPMGLRDKYAYAIQTAKGVKMQGAAEEREGKLYFHGTVSTEDEVNEIWNAIKTIPDWRNDVVADIKATGASSAAAPAAERTYTVKSGDTLSKI